jgi:hypothetical protein
MSNVEVIANRSAFTWSVVIAGALAAWAVSFIFISLGTGIGFTIASPYSSTGSASFTIAGAIWLIFAETVAFTAGGYLAGRLRIRDHIPGPETMFRDAAHGFMVWVVGVGLMAVVIAIASAFASGAGTSAAPLAESAQKAAAYLSFWSFMALLFGAVAATLAGILGGELRDELPETGRARRRRR